MGKTKTMNQKDGRQSMWIGNLFWYEIYIYAFGYLASQAHEIRLDELLLAYQLFKRREHQILML